VPRRLSQPGARSRCAATALTGLLLGARAAAAQPSATPPPPPPEPSPLATEPAQAERELGGRVGLASGGRVTPGGLRIDGHYLYQLSEVDWFEGAASFTYGGGGPACFRDRADVLVCDHGLLAGVAAGFDATVRRRLGGQAGFWPYARVGLGLRLVRFADDDVSGLAVPLVVGAGVRARVGRGVAIAAEATGEAGLAYLSRGLGPEPQLGLVVAVGVEFRLR
jgi:hypothetical protein